MDIKLFNVIGIVNEGYSELVMEVAKECGARGGTIIPANGSVSQEAMKLYGIGIHPEKEIVMILVKDDLALKILDKLYDKAGTGTDAMGIFFTLPVSHASENILNQYKKKKEKEEWF